MNVPKCLLFLLLLLFAFETEAQKVYKTPFGKRYHLATCHMVENVSAEMEIDKAVELGLTPCKICRPPAIPDTLGFQQNTPRGVKHSVRCKGMTQRGTRCLHYTSIANGICFQHNPDRLK